VSDDPKHCAPFSLELIPQIAELLWEHGGEDCHLVLDPFAGIGRIHQLREPITISGMDPDDWVMWETIGVEIEEPWARQNPFTRVGNALALDFPDGIFDAVVTSPTYGNRMADHHVAKDKSHRRTYKHYLGQDLSPENSGQLQWGQEYRDFHQRAWEEVRRVLAPGGIFIINIKDHQRNKRRAHVSNWHYQTIKALGFELVDVRRVGTPGYRYGENREVRYPERLLVFRKNEPDVISLHGVAA
jgi:tRNA G10  N-methylase Trm11